MSNIPDYDPSQIINSLAKNADVFIVSTEGGVDIEEVAEKSPEKIIKAWVKEDTYSLSDAVNTVINALDLSNFCGSSPYVSLKAFLMSL